MQISKFAGDVKLC